jgi:hypothetical protein
MQVSDVKPISDAISGPVIKAYTAGGYGLVTVMVGVILLLVGGLLHSGPGYAIAAIGTAMIFAFLYFFYVHDVKRLRDVSRQITDNKELIDTVQLMAIEMTDLAHDLQALAFKHADDVAHVLTQVRSASRGLENLPVLSRVPGVKQLAAVADHPIVVRAEDLSSAIVRSTVATRQIIEDVKQALVRSDPALLKKYLQQVRELESEAQLLLEGRTAAANAATGDPLEDAGADYPDRLREHAALGTRARYDATLAQVPDIDPGRERDRP